MTVDRKVFQSSMLESGSYDSDTQTLTITFANGQSYQAEDVPASVWQGLRQASSPGRHFHKEVKPLYNFTKT